MNCPKCNVKVNENVKFCSNCGINLVNIQQSEFLQKKSSSKLPAYLKALFTVIGICIIALVIGIGIFLFDKSDSKDKNKEATSNSKYVAGVYSTSVMLNGSTFDVEVVVDESRINSIQLKNISETVTTMYPLLKPSLENIAQQVYENQSTKNISYDEDNKYTSMVLIEAIESALEKAKMP